MTEQLPAAETTEAAGEPQPVLLRIVNPDATAEEVAAIVAVFSALGGSETPKPKPRPEWNTPARMVRPTVFHGPGGWRASSLPR